MSQLYIQLSAVSKSFQSLTIFDAVSFSINEGDRFALVGENGSGKTTLLKLLMGGLKPDSGRVTRAEDISIGYLPQEVTIEAETVRGYLEDDRFSELERRMAECLENQDRLEEWEQCHELYVQLGGYRRAPIEKVFLGLKIDNELLNCSVLALSSGQKVRVALAKVLIENPDLLLLDEPTNHLDDEMVIWLQDLLRDRQGATVVVSHDRKFINQVCNHLIEIRHKTFTSYGGNYDFFLLEKERLLQKSFKAFEEQKEKKGELKQKIKAMTFAKKKPRPPKDRNFMAYDRRGEHHQKSVQRTLEGLKAQLEDIERNLMENPKPKEFVGIRFAPHSMASQTAIEIRQIDKGYGEKQLFSRFSKMIRSQDRVIVTGPNGSGKTTLLKCIAGIEQVDKGEVSFSSGLRIGYLDQEGEGVPMELSPLQYFGNRFQLTEENLRRELHMAGLGGDDLLSRPFSTLSAGQRKRLMILHLMLEKPNVLLLDEPTNHLDLLTVEALEKAIGEFEGAVIAVSHDPTFIDKVGIEKWELDQPPRKGF